MDIPYQQLSPQVLQGILEEFVSREGTDYGARDYTLIEKVNQVRCQLERGDAQIVFDPKSQTCNVILSRKKV